ncbi:hypothetical protein EYR41_007679 [Orbilia oligospora]|uniref:Uncharacterized protein n=1 Tax=Orbilia oligospora TaxID=2813651 RepID=A0A7C8PE37_ORBOL|nr:hypothetical protein TWF751_007058 [Orbilia oligospora]TGJ66017.1 hypothetical protein EYR41_007679 [Orbilia oligospora]
MTVGDIHVLVWLEEKPQAQHKEAGPEQDKSDLRTGLILVGLVRCIAMVLIWNSLAGDNQNYCAILAVVNSILQVLFAPLAVFFIRIISIGEQFKLSSTVMTNVAVFLGIPLGVVILIKFLVRKFVEPTGYKTFMKWLFP